MANSIRVTKLIEGQRDAYFHIYILGDGSATELTNETVVDPTVDLNPTMDHVPTFTLVEVWYSVPQGNLILSFNDLNPTQMWVLNGNDSNHISFDKFGGLKDTSGIDGTGTLLVSTVGLQTGSKTMSMVVKLRKN
jgi:hypothetical protein